MRDWSHIPISAPVDQVVLSMPSERTEACSLVAFAGAKRSEDSLTNHEHAPEKTIVGANTEYVPVTMDRCDHIEGPFYHGTKSTFEVGDQLGPGHGSNFHNGRASNNVYFSALVDTAVWGAELATALAGRGERGHIYVVEPTGPFEDDPNVTNKRFAGNITQSYRTRHPLQIVGEVRAWEGHAPEVLNGMLNNIARLREQGLDVIDD